MSESWKTSVDSDGILVFVDVRSPLDGYSHGYVTEGPFINLHPSSGIVGLKINRSSVNCPWQLWPLYSSFFRSEDIRFLNFRIPFCVRSSKVTHTYYDLRTWPRISSVSSSCLEGDPRSIPKYLRDWELDSDSGFLTWIIEFLHWSSYRTHFTFLRPLSYRTLSLVYDEFTTGADVERR